MKKLIVTSTTVLFIGLTAFAQDLSYNKKWFTNENATGVAVYRDLDFYVKGRYTRPVTKEKLDNARLLSDFIPGYPTNWIADYTSSVIWATCNGKVVKALSPNDVLSIEQKNILSAVDPGTGIIVNVKYKGRNSVTDDITDNEMNVSMMIIPEQEAEYAGGEQQMKKYLQENVINKISETTHRQLQNASAVATFTVNEKGKIVNAEILKTSGDSKTDKLLIDAINKMPEWIPAENSKGIKVKQEFEFSVGNSGC